MSFNISFKLFYTFHRNFNYLIDAFWIFYHIDFCITFILYLSLNQWISWLIWNLFIKLLLPIGNNLQRRGIGGRTTITFTMAVSNWWMVEKICFVSLECLHVSKLWYWLCCRKGDIRIACRWRGVGVGVRVRLRLFCKLFVVVVIDISTKSFFVLDRILYIF